MFFLYIKTYNANIKYRVLSAIVIIFSLIIFPIFLKANISFSKEKNKMFFVFYLFGVKVIKGYAEIISEGRIVHLTKTKAI